VGAVSAERATQKDHLRFVPCAGMQLEAFVLPLPDRSMGVVFWDRVRRRGGHSSLDVYAPAELSPGELSEVSGCLTAAIGGAIGGNERGALAPWMMVAWWGGGVLCGLLLALRGLELGPAFSWMAVVAMGATLPWGYTARAFSDAATARAARRVAAQLGEISPAPGNEQRLRERLLAVWQFAKGQRGTYADQILGLERFCQEQTWPAAAGVYADRRRDAERGQGTDAPARRRFGRRAGPRHRLYAACEMRAWQLS
jgi:hypothetical protein